MPDPNHLLSTKGQEGDVDSTEQDTSGPTNPYHREDPAEFIRNLAFQTQLLSCLKWLNHVQVLACMPLRGSISFEEIAELAAVQEDQLRRAVRVTAMAGFLHELHPGHISHTKLSASFMTNLVFPDAAAFLAETAAPAALNMASQEHESHTQGSPPFALQCTARTKLLRQWSAYHNTIDNVEDGVIQVLGRLQWAVLGGGRIVDACAYSTDAAAVLSQMHPALHFIVQIITPGRQAAHEGSPENVGERITVQGRTAATAQVVSDADVYMLRLTTPLEMTPLPEQVQAELRAHLGVLRARPSATLILATPFSPEPGTVAQDVETRARVRDLGRLQLMNQPEMELDALVEMINGVSDSDGGLSAVSKTIGSQSAVVVIGVQYRIKD